MKNFILLLYVLPLLLQGQYVKFKSFSLKTYPVINFTITVEDDSGKIYPVSIESIRIYEDSNLVRNFRLYPLDSIKVPVYAAIVLDRSGSMEGIPIKEAKEGAKIFVSMMDSSDKTAYIVFDDKVHLKIPLTNKKEILFKTISNTYTQGNTALYDAVLRAINLFQNVRGNVIKVVIALTDGVDNRSKSSLSDIINMANRFDVRIYTIGLGNKINKKILKELAYATEGNYYYAPSPSDIKKLYKKISILLHSSMLISYYSHLPLNGKWYPVEVVIFSDNKIIKGSRKFLFAKHPKIPRYLLEQIDAASVVPVANNSQNNFVMSKSIDYIKILLYVLIGLTVLLIAILIYKILL